MTTTSAVRALSALAVVACLAVATAVAVHTSALGPDPAWLFDCDDTTCEDLWADARSHYRTVSVWSVTLGVLGWLLHGLTRPRLSESGSHPRRSLGPAYAVAVAVGPLAAPVVSIMVFESVTAALTACMWIATLAAAALWWFLRAGTGRDRWSWFAAAGIVVAVSLAGFVAAATLFWPMLFVAVFLGVAPVSAVAGAIGVHVAARCAAARPTGGAPEARGRASEAGSRAPMAGVVVVGALLICAGASVAAWPVPARPADAVAAPTDTDGPPDERVTPTEPVPPPLDSGSDASAPAVPFTDPDGLPPCGGDGLTLTLRGWDSYTGNSTATLVAANSGPAACALSGSPTLEIHQGGRDLAVRTVPLEPHRLTSTPPARGVGLAPGESAESTVFWRGYRGAADQSTPQTVWSRPSAEGRRVQVTIEPSEYGDPAPAPFDLIPGAEVELGPWSVPAR